MLSDFYFLCFAHQNTFFNTVMYPQWWQDWICHWPELVVWGFCHRGFCHQVFKVSNWHLVFNSSFPKFPLIILTVAGLYVKYSSIQSRTQINKQVNQHHRAIEAANNTMTQSKIAHSSPFKVLFWLLDVHISRQIPSIASLLDSTSLDFFPNLITVNSNG